MLTRYMGMSAKSQSYLFTFGWVITLLAMVLTDLWLPIVVGALVMTGLVIESWIRVAHILPMRKEMRQLQAQVDKLNSQRHQQNNG
ncbi:hypothetical protein BCU68_15490 [Vibrio sp. 10N.286.49.B3]|uniref:hypothetical protein n=1 Tax=Vibrio sp. 10N.286.49.B3 TaxID=1880855 RepID=UPI000C829B61|nr:hypothetical protein [Vibrio sp. 10N.286.49.B3]PMH41463.1 hypothetical protein BCU68_15490 [Vibrio sp. 10N.286.49.B3]